MWYRIVRFRGWLKKIDFFVQMYTRRSIILCDYYVYCRFPFPLDNVFWLCAFHDENNIWRQILFWSARWFSRRRMHSLATQFSLYLATHSTISVCAECRPFDKISALSYFLSFSLLAFPAVFQLLARAPPRQFSF